MKKLQISFAMLLLAIVASTTAAHSQKTPGGVTPIVLYNLGTHADDPIGVQGSFALGRDGNLYGTSTAGGAFGDGTIWKYIFISGELKLLHSFGGSDGKAPMGGLTLGGDGNFYFTTSAGGQNGWGTFGRINQNGKNFAIRYNFTNGSDGGTPRAPLLADPNGDFFGTDSTGGGSASCGTVFKVNPMTTPATLTTLHTFVDSDGCHSWGPLAPGEKPFLLGTTYAGSPMNQGTIFKISLTGNTFQTIFNFNGANGSGPYGLTPGNSASRYFGGTTAGGLNDNGVIFWVTPAANFKDIFSFGANESPNVNLTLTFNGVCGVTPQGGTSDDGTVFCQSEKTPYTFTNEANFVLTLFGGTPDAPLLELPSGPLVTATTMGAKNNKGALDSIDLGLGPSVSLVEEFAHVGDVEGVIGEGFSLTASTIVLSSGVTAHFTYVNPEGTYGEFVVPAITGPGLGFNDVTVFTGGTSVQSNTPLEVYP